MTVCETFYHSPHGWDVSKLGFGCAQFGATPFSAGYSVTQKIKSSAQTFQRERTAINSVSTGTSFAILTWSKASNGVICAVDPGNC